MVERLGTIRRAAQLQLDAGAEGITSADVNRTQVYLRLADARRTQATQGVKRALAALREGLTDHPVDAEPRVDRRRRERPTSVVRDQDDFGVELRAEASAEHVARREDPGSGLPVISID